MCVYVCVCVCMCKCLEVRQEGGVEQLAIEAYTHLCTQTYQHPVIETDSLQPVSDTQHRGSLQARANRLLNRSVCGQVNASGGCVCVCVRV